MAKRYVVKQTWNGYVIINLANGLGHSVYKDSRAALAAARDLNRMKGA